MRCGTAKCLSAAGANEPTIGDRSRHPIPKEMESADPGERDDHQQRVVVDHRSAARLDGYGMAAALERSGRQVAVQIVRQRCPASEWRQARSSDAGDQPARQSQLMRHAHGSWRRLHDDGPDPRTLPARTSADRSCLRLFESRLVILPNLGGTRIVRQRPVGGSPYRFSAIPAAAAQDLHSQYRFP